MKSMRSLLFSLVPVLLPVAALGQPDAVDPEAVRLLRESTTYLAGLKQFRLETASTIESVTSTGQKLQFDVRVQTWVKRPNQFRAERVGEKFNQVLSYDGKSLSMSMADARYYATVDAPPSLDAMLDFARDQLHVAAPGTDLVYSNAFDRLTESLDAAMIVGEATIAGVPCVHLALRNPQVDWQIWIQQGGQPLPRKFVVTSKRMPSSPQFEMTVTRWDVAAKVDDSVFRFAAPKTWKKIDFLPVAASTK